RLAQLAEQPTLHLVSTMLDVANPLAGVGVTLRPLLERGGRLDGERGLLAQASGEVGFVGQEPMGHVSHLQTGTNAAATRPQTGRVTTQASSRRSTTRQRTWVNRRRDAPTPTTDAASTCVVLTGAPISDDTSTTPVVPESQTKPS